MMRLLAAASAALALAACQDQSALMKAATPIPARTVALMSEKGMAPKDPILVRVYKKEAELEVWKKTAGHYALLKSFPICRWSGQLGPKVREGDRQAPEGFYDITPARMNPNSSYYLSFDTGFPNAYDRANNRSGSYLMVHGTCSSRGCYAMTDEGIAEVYALAREAFSGGQKSFQFQAYPFRMTADNLARYRQDPNMAFWKNLKQGADHFEITRREPKVSVCKGRYAFDTVGGECAPDPTLAPAVAQKEEADERAVADLVQRGTPAVRLVYADGGQHESFKAGGPSFGSDSGSNFAILDSRPRRNIGDVSRPEALAEGPREVSVETSAKPGPRPSTAIAALSRPDRSRVAEAPARTGSVAANPGRTVVASADPDAPVAARAAEPETQPLYRRVMGNVFGETPAAPAPAAAPADPKPTPATTPARKAAAAPARKDSKGRDAKARDAKPVAQPEPKKKQAQATHLVPSNQPVGPSTTSFRTN